MLALGTPIDRRGGDLRRFDTTQHPLYCGIDWHARRMSGGLLNHAGASLLPRHLPAAPEPFRKAIAPYRDGLVGAVEGLLPWYGRAALWAPAGMAFVLGHAL